MATAQANADNAAAPLGQLLVDVGAGPLRRWLPGRPGGDFIASLAGRPGKVGRRLSIMVGELDRVALGRSAVEPKRGDRRFADPAWTHNPWLRRLVQAYLATGDAVAGLVDDAGLAWRSDHQIRFLAENLVEAISTKIAGGSQLNWLQAVARSQTKFVTDLVSMYADAIRSGPSG